MPNYIIAAQTYTVRDYMKTDAEFAESMKKLRDTGFTAVQLSGHNAVTPAFAAEILKEEGLACCITHTPIDKILGDFETVVKNHKAWGCGFVGIGGLGGEYSGSAEGYRAFAKLANEIGGRLADCGMKFAYHNHAFEFIRLDGGAKGMDILLSELGENVEFIPDLYWLQYAGADVYGWLENVRGRASTVHFKDYRIDPQTGKSDFAEIGNGNMDYVKLSKICDKIGIKYAAVEQDSCPGNPFDSLKMSFEYLQTMGN